MLRAPVVEAVRNERFRIHAVDSVDQAIELFTGVSAGARAEGEDDRFQEGSVNDRVDRALETMAQRIREFGDSGERRGMPDIGPGNDEV